jgi:hypothetical protein
MREAADWPEAWNFKGSYDFEEILLTQQAASPTAQIFSVLDELINGSAF